MPTIDDGPYTKEMMGLPPMATAKRQHVRLVHRQQEERYGSDERNAGVLLGDYDGSRENLLMPYPTTQ